MAEDRQRTERGPTGRGLTLTQCVVVLPASRPNTPKEEQSPMAESLTARLSLDEVRASVKRVRTEGRKLVTRLRKDATALVNRRPLDVLADARKGATKAVQELDAQRHRGRTRGSGGPRFGSLVLEVLASVTDEAVARAGLAKAQDVSELKRRVHDLERRIERV